MSATIKPVVQIFTSARDLLAEFDNNGAKVLGNGCLLGICTAGVFFVDETAETPNGDELLPEGTTTFMQAFENTKNGYEPVNQDGTAITGDLAAALVEGLVANPAGKINRFGYLSTGANLNRVKLYTGSAGEPTRRIIELRRRDDGRIVFRLTPMNPAAGPVGF